MQIVQAQFKDAEKTRHMTQSSCEVKSLAFPSFMSLGPDLQKNLGQCVSLTLECPKSLLTLT